MNSNDKNSRRNFLKKAGGIYLGMAGISVMSGTLPYEIEDQTKAGKLFTKEIIGVKDRIERV